MRSVLYRDAALLATLVVFVALAVYTPLFVEAQEEVPRVVKVDVSPTTVYRGYQSIEVTVYVYLPPGSGLLNLSGTASLYGGGIRQEMSMARIVLTTPVTVTVDNKTYSVSNLLVIRVPVSTALSPGPASLTISVSGAAVMGNTTYDLSRTYSFRITVLDNTPVELKRQEALLSLERVRTLFTVLESLGIGIPGELRQRVDTIENLFEKADNLLYALGDVDSALATYSDVETMSRAVATDIAILIATYIRSIDTTLSQVNTSISARLDTAERSIKSLADSVSTLSKNIQDLARVFSNYTASMDTVIKAINTNIDNTNTKIDNLVKALNTELNNKISVLTDNINKNFENINSVLSSIQLVLLVPGIAVLVVGVVGFVKK